MDASDDDSACTGRFRLCSRVLTSDICLTIIATTGRCRTTDEILNLFCLSLGELICNAGDLLG